MTTEDQGEGRAAPATTIDPAAAFELWQQARWQDLAAAPPASDTARPDRIRIALLRAAALLQLGRSAEARADVAALLTGPEQRRAAARILLAGAYDTLGRTCALLGDDAAAAADFRQAVDLADPPEGTDPATAAHQHAFHQLTELGLLTQASGAVDAELERVVEETPAARLWLADRIAMLSSEISTVNHELTIAITRNQLYRKAPGAGDDRQSLRERSPSQLGQDLWVLEQTGFKRGGYFVEFGATDGVLLSNTYLLEKEFDWSGICIDPNPEYFEKLRSNRSCIVDDACIAGRSGDEVEFILAQEYGGIAGFADSDQHSDRRDAYRQQQRTLRLRTQSLDEVLTRLGAPTDIDYISIDTEGSEFDILRTFPLDRWNVRCFTIEHNHSAQRQAIHELLSAHGYQRTPARWDDWYRR